MTDNILALYFLTCQSIGNKNRRVSNAASDVAENLWNLMTPAEQAASFEIEDKARRLIDERLAAGGTNG